MRALIFGEVYYRNFTVLAFYSLDDLTEKVSIEVAEVYELNV